MVEIQVEDKFSVIATEVLRVSYVFGRKKCFIVSELVNNVNKSES